MDDEIAFRVNDPYSVLPMPFPIFRLLDPFSTRTNT